MMMIMTPDHDGDDEDDDHDDDDDHDPEEEDDDDKDLGHVSLSSSSPLIACVSDTKVGLSATLASLILMTITKKA